VAAGKPTAYPRKRNQSTVPDGGAALAASETTQMPMSQWITDAPVGSWIGRIEGHARPPHRRSS